MFLIMILDLDVKFEKSMWYQKKKRRSTKQVEFRYEAQKKKFGLEYQFGSLQHVNIV